MIKCVKEWSTIIKEISKISKNGFKMMINLNKRKSLRNKKKFKDIDKNKSKNIIDNYHFLKAINLVEI